MCGRWWHICYRSLLAILRKKVGEPKEESRNLYGIAYVNLYTWICRYNFVHLNSHIQIYCPTSYMWIRMIYEFTCYKLYFPPLSIKVISMDTTGRLLLEEYGPEIVYIQGIHNTVADAISRLEYNPSVNWTAENYHMTKVKERSSKRSQRQSWMTFSKHWCNLKIDTNKPKDLNFVFANHGEGDDIYPLTTIEIAEAQRNDQEL